MMYGGLYSPDELPVNYHKGAIFTVELGSLVENGFDLGLQDYPIFDEAYRDPLNNKIIEHYYFREIGQETPGLFKRFLNRKMNEIMPYYNQLYASASLITDPLTNMTIISTGQSTGASSTESNATRTEQATTDASSSTDNTNTAKARTVVSVTPQMQLSAHDDYATNLTDTNNESTGTAASSSDSTSKTDGADSSKTDANTTDEYINHVSGLSGITESAALQEFRATFLNIDMMIIDDLAELFMGLYTDYWNAL